MHRTNYPEGTTATCVHCHQEILLDQREGGGPGKDWGSPPEDWVGNGGIGMDYGCDSHPNTNEDGCWGHEPDPDDIKDAALPREPVPAPEPGEMVTLTVTLPRNTVERLHGTTVEHWTDGAGSLQVDGFDTINVQFSEYGSEAAAHVGDVADLYLTAVLTVLDRTIAVIDPYMDKQLADDLDRLRTELEGKR